MKDIDYVEFSLGLAVVRMKREMFYNLLEEALGRAKDKMKKAKSHD